MTVNTRHIKPRGRKIQTPRMLLTYKQNRLTGLRDSGRKGGKRTYVRYICLICSTDIGTLCPLGVCSPAKSAMVIKPPVDVPTIMLKASVGCNGSSTSSSSIWNERCTMVQRNQESRSKYWVTRSSIRLFAHTANSFA